MARFVTFFADMVSLFSHHLRFFVKKVCIRRPQSPLEAPGGSTKIRGTNYKGPQRLPGKYYFGLILGKQNTKNNNFLQGQSSRFALGSIFSVFFVSIKLQLGRSVLFFLQARLYSVSQNTLHPARTPTSGDLCNLFPVFF